jgi:hypothetical protein
MLEIDKQVAKNREAVFLFIRELLSTSKTLFIINYSKIKCPNHESSKDI